MKTIQELLTKIEEMDNEATKGPWWYAVVDECPIIINDVNDPKQVDEKGIIEMTECKEGDLDFITGARSLLPKCGKIIKIFLEEFEEMGQAAFHDAKGKIQKILED